MPSLHFEKLGPIKKGQIDLTNDLTIIVGKNNTGKSYVSYLYYGFLKLLDPNHPFGFHQILQKKINSKFKLKIASTGPNSISIDFESYVNKYFENFFPLMSETLNDAALTIFATTSVRPKVSIRLEDDDKRELISDILSELKATEISFPMNFGDGGVTVYKEKNSGSFSYVISGKDIKGKNIAFTEKDKREMETQLSFFYNNIFLSLFFDVFGRSFFFPAERGALNIFAKHIIREKYIWSSDIFNPQPAIFNYSNKRRDYDSYSRYGIAISDYVYFMNDLDDKRKKQSRYYDIGMQLENEILMGSVILTKLGGLAFHIKGAPKGLIDYHMTSSSIKSLSGLAIYFKFLAKKGDVVFIDEPELNLHPDNQRKFVRLLAKATKKGIKFIISTHSDYIIKEFNNLMAMSRLPKNNNLTKKILKKWNYHSTEILDPHKVGAYMIGNNQITPLLDIERNGIEVSTIDDEINNLNTSTEEIYSALFKD